MSKRGIHDAISTNCIAEVELSKPTHSGMVTRKPATAQASATQRASAASRSRLKPSTATPAAIGTQIDSDRYGVIGGTSSHAPPVEEPEHPDDHHERVVVDVARLDVAHHARHDPDQPRRAVDEPVVDQRAVAVVRREAPEPARPAGDEPVVEATFLR